MSSHLQKHKVDNMNESDAHMVMAWLSDAIDSLEEPIAKQDAPFNQTDDTIYPQNPGDNLVIEANSKLELEDTDKSKTNIPPEFSQREKEDTAAMPFLRRKGKRSNEESETIEKAIEGLRAWAAIEKAAFSLDDAGEQCDTNILLKAFSIDEESFDLSQVLKGTFLEQILTAPNRPSVAWWQACSELMKSLEGLEEPGSFATSLYYYPDDFDPDEFISKTDENAIATSGENITVLDYATKNFDICPGAVTAFENIVEGAGNSPTDVQALIKKAAKETDRFLGMEKKFLDKAKLDTNELEEMVRSIANTHYMVGQLSEQLDQDFTNDFVFAAGHITNVSFMLEGLNTELQKIAVSNPDTLSIDKNVEDLIYTEDVELCKCGSDIEKCGHKRDVKDMESPAETGPMDRGEARPNVIMRSENSVAT